MVEMRSRIFLATLVAAVALTGTAVLAADQPRAPEPAQP